MFMQGGPTHLETFDHKPELIKAGAKTVNGKGPLSPRFEFKPSGKSGS